MTGLHHLRGGYTAMAWVVCVLAFLACSLALRPEEQKMLETGSADCGPGFYRLVARQTWGAFPSFIPGAWRVNSDDPTAFNYAILDELETYRLTTGPNKGSFQFKIQWPAVSTNEWIQTSNPTKSTTVAGYKAVNVTHTEQTWGGLMTGSQYALLDGSLDSGLWFYAVGSFQEWGGGIPACGPPAVQVVELYVWDDTGAQSPDYALGPTVVNGQYRLVARQTLPFYATANQWSLNEQDARSFQYYNLNALENFRLTSGKNAGSLQFRLSWPGQTDQDWVQSSNPVQSATVTGYSPIDVQHLDNYWGGLHKDNQYALLSGSSTWPNYWFYAVGSFKLWSTGIPAFAPASQVVNLYVLDPSIKPAPKPKGFYRLVARQTWGAGVFKPGQWSVNSDDPTAFNYAILDQLENYRLTTGPNKDSFQFRLRWPAETANEWIQTSNPTQSTTVTGYQNVKVTHVEHTWGGLMTGSSYALLDGSTSAEWFYAVGSFQIWGAGIPAWNPATQVVELDVWDDTGAAVPDYSVGPKTGSGSRYRLVARQTIPGYFVPNTWSFNQDRPQSFNYLNLDNLENFRLQNQNKGSFQFLLTWPGQTPQEWVQSSNPVQSATVTGYSAVNVNHQDNFWGGLHKDNQYALLSGSTTWPNYWFYAVGSFQAWSGGIPAFNAASQVANLYVVDDVNFNFKGGYRLVARQTWGAGLFAPGQWRVNSDDPTAFNYAILDELESYRLTSGPNTGALQFKLRWPNLSDNEWIQTSNPVTSTSVSGYKAVNVPYTMNYWGGLMTGSQYTLLDGSTTDWWYYAVGSFQAWNGAIPGPLNATQVVELYVYDDTSNSAQDYALGPSTSNGRYRLVARQTVPLWFTPDQWSLNKDEPRSFNYANLDALESYRLHSGQNKGSFQFRLTWPGQDLQEWVQSSNPTQNAQVEGYAALEVNHLDNHWAGLHKDGKYALVSGSFDWPSYWWYAVGSFQNFQGGIPAFNTPSQVVNLYVLDDQVSPASKPGVYRLVARQTWGAGVFKPGQWSVNSDDPTAFNYAILDQLENFRLTSGPNKGSFRFKLRWPTASPQEWIQTSNPTTSTTVTGYRPVSVPSNANYWGGLMTGSQYTLLDGSTTDWWYYAVGSFQAWNGGIPGPNDAVQVVELYAFDDTGNGLPDYCAGPVVSGGQYRLVSRQTVPFYFVAQGSFNKQDARAFNYFNFDNLDTYRFPSGSNVGSLQFRLTWPGQTPNEWIQSSNPAVTQGVTGYVPVTVNHQDNWWGGLHKDGKYAFVSGGTNWPSSWWYAIGSFQDFQGGIPAFNTPSQVVNLYVLDPRGH